MKRSMWAERSLRRGVWCAATVSAMLAVANAGAQATTAQLAGVVVTETGDPLAGVALSIGQSDATARTDASGRFEFATAPWGQVRLRARALGFAPKDTVMNLQSGTSYAVRLQLTRFVPQLDTVRVQETLTHGKPARYQHTGKFDDFYERRARRPGTFFTREDIERSGSAKVSDLILKVPGVAFRYQLTPRGNEAYIRVARCMGTGGATRIPAGKVLAVFLDGQRLGGDPMDVLGELLTSEIETMEFYRGPSQLPMEAVGDACAAVFITTRFSPGSVINSNR